MKSAMGARIVLSTALSSMFVTPIGADEVFDARGFNPHRDTFTQLPYEHVDPMTGNLLLTHTDLVLPGNAGFDLVVQRTYNSKIYRNYQFQGGTLDEDSWTGVGWSLHFGRILNPDAAVPGPIEMSDGSRHALYRHIDGSGRFITTEFWVYDKNTDKLSLPNGRVYTFGHSASVSSTPAAYATDIRDPFGNFIQITYASGAGTPPDAISQVVQNLGTQQRTITFAYNSGLGNSLSSMTFGSRVWTFTQETTSQAGFTILKRVQPPTTGAPWRYEYATTGSPQYELTRVTTPHGGQIDYTYAEVFMYLGTTIGTRVRAVTERSLASVRDVVGGTWTYAYGQGASKDRTVITAPSCGVATTTTYTFFGIGTSPPSGPVAWKIGTMASVVVASGATTLESRAMTWRASVAISNDPRSAGAANDPQIFVPLPEAQSVTRGSSTFQTSYSYGTANYNDYGRANTTTETGDAVRTTMHTFQYGFTPYIVDRIATETVSVGSETFATRSYAYNSSTGFRTSETLLGVTVTFTPDGRGNVASRQDALNPATTFQYSWGRVSQIATPEHTTTRTINSDGTVASETRRGFTTSYQYDNLFRVTQVTPPVGNATVTEYVTQGAGTPVWTATQVTRGISEVTTNLDGLGRATSTLNAVGVQTDVNYDACGRKTYQSFPYTVQNIGDTFQYDGLGRPTRTTHPDGSFATRSYTGIDVRITDEEGRITDQGWQAFGNPDDARLTTVIDGDQKTTHYTYNALGSLRIVDPPAGANRSWQYNSKNQLISETHPESGTVDYTYDAAGNLKTRTDAQFGQTLFEYDDNNRLIFLNRPGVVHDTQIGYDDSDNRTSIANGYVSSSFVYDGANRMSPRTDQVGGSTFVTSYLYDGNDNLMRITYPSSRPIAYAYDAGGRITAVTDGASTSYATAFSYHPSGALAGFTSGNGVAQSFTYDNRYRLKDLDVAGVRSLTHHYDDVGNVVSIIDSRPGMDRSFTYDDVDRLLTASGFWGTGSYAYDEIGNRTQKTVGGSVTYSYGSTTNRLTQAGAETFSYDSNGNLMNTPGAQYAYTPENMLETATTGSGTTTYRYDGDNLRKMKLGPDGNRYFVHGPGGQLLSEYQVLCNGSVEPVREYVYAGSRLIASVRPSATSATASLALASSTVAEAGGNASVVVRLITSDGQPIPCAVTVAYSTQSGTASTGADYTSVQGTITFPAGSASAATQTLQIPVANDSLDEDSETFSVVLTPGIGASVGSPSQHVVTIADDDPPPSLTFGDATVTEGNAGIVLVTVPVTLSAASGRAVAIDYSTANGTASSSDYVATSGTLNFAAGTTSQSVTVSVRGDVLDEADETFTLVASGPVNVTIADGVGTVTIVDNDAPPALSVTNAGALEGNAGSASMVFRVTLSSPSGRTLSVDYATANGTAAAGTDYTATSGTLTFAAGETSKTVGVTILGDTATEPNESFTLVLSNPVNGTIANGIGTGTIFTDDTSCTISINPVSQTIDRRAGGGSIAVTASSPSCAWSAISEENWLTLPSGTSGVGSGTVTFWATAYAGSADRIGRIQVQGVVFSLTQKPSEGVVWKNPANVTVSGNSLTRVGGPAWDAGATSVRSLPSGDGFVDFTVSEAATYRMAGLGTGDTDRSQTDVEFALYAYADGTIRISESGNNQINPANGTVTFGTYVQGDRFRVAVEEGVVRYYKGGALLYTSSSAPIYPLQVDTSLWSTGATIWDAVIGGGFAFNQPPTAEAGGPYAGAAGFPLTLSASGSTDTDGAIASYAWDFGDGTTGSGVSPQHTYAAAGNYVATVVVTDGDGASSSDLASVTIGSAENVVWTSLVNVTANGNSLTKTAGGDAWNAGAVSNKSFTGDGFVEFTAAETTSYRVCGLGNGNSDATMADVDFGFYLYAGDVRIVEAGVTRTAPNGTPTFTTHVSGDRFKVAVEGGVVKYYKNGSTLLYTSTVSPTYPLQVDTSFWSPSSTVNSAVISFDSRPQVLVNDVAVTEGNSGTVNVTFTVSLSASYTQTVTVAYATANGTATEPGDYTSTSGTLTFLPTETTKTVNVAVSGDAADEGNETFFLNLSSPTNATLGDSQGQATIGNDDGPPTENVVWTSLVNVTASGNSLTKTAGGEAWNAGAVSNKSFTGDGFVEFTAAETTSYRVCGLGNGNMDATMADVDFGFYLYAGTVRIVEGGVTRTAPGGTHTFTTHVSGDRFKVAVEGGVVKYYKNGTTLLYTSTVSPTFPLLVDTAFWSPSSTVNSAVISFDPRPQVSVNDVVVTEGNSGTANASFTVSLSASYTQTVTVAYATANGTATEPSDYTSTSGTLTFLPTETTKTVAVTVSGDAADEGNETFILNLSSPTNATLGDSQGQATISNDDGPPIENVVWTSLVNVTATGNSLTKTAGGEAWNGGAVSNKSFTGDGFVEFTAAETTTYRVCGLANGNTDASMADVDFGFYLYAGAVRIVEGGVTRTAPNGTHTFTTHVAGDRFKVAVEGGVVKYYKNGSTLLYTSTVSPTFPLLVDTAFWSPSSTVNSAVISFDPRPQVSVNDVVVTEGNSGTVNASFTVSLSASYTQTVTVAYATANGTATEPSDYTSTSGTLTFLPTETTKTVLVAVNGDAADEGTETFVLNLSSPTNATLGDSQGQATISNDDGPPIENVVWMTLVNVSATGNSLTKTAGGDAWNGGAVSTKSFTGVGYVDFVASETTTYRICGLGNGNTDQDKADIEYGIYLYGDGTVRIMESGVSRTTSGGSPTFTTFIPGDHFKVAVEGGVVKYYKNGSTLLYTSAVSPTFPLRVDTSIWSAGGTINGVVISGDLQ